MKNHPLPFRAVFSRRSLILVTAAAVSGCASTLPIPPGEKFFLAVGPQPTVNVPIIDLRPDAERKAGAVERGFRIGDADLDPNPASYVSTEMARVLSIHESKAKLEALLAGKPILLRKFEVLVLRPDLGPVSRNATPGAAAFEALLKVALERASRSEVRVNIAIEVEGKVYEAWGRALEQVVPFSQSPVSAAKEAVEGLVTNLASNVAT